MSTVSAPPPQPPTPSAGAPAQAVVTVRDAPQALLDAPPGTQMAMRVLAAVRGALEASSEFGQLTLKTPLPPLPSDTLLTLAMTGSGKGQATLRVIAIDGKPLTQALADIFANRGGAATVPLQDGRPVPLPDASGRPLPTAPQTATAALTAGRGPGAGPVGASPTPAPTAAADAVALSQGLLRATVLTGARRLNPDLAQVAPRPRPLAPGTMVELRLLTVQGRPIQSGAPGPTAPGAPPSAAPTPGATPATAPGPAAPTPTAPSGGPATAPAPAATTPATTPTPAAGSASPSQPPSPAPRPAGSGTVVQGVVASNSAGGATLLRTDVGMLALQGRTSLPPGAAVTLEVVTSSPPQAPVVAPPPTAPTVLAAGPAQGVSAWPALTEALDVLSRTDPVAAQALARAIPAPDSRMVANAVAFLQASQSGDLRHFTGDRVLRALERAGPKGRELIDRLGDDMRDLSTRVREGGGGGGSEWRTQAMPFAAGGQIDRIAVVTRREGDGDGDGSGTGRESGTRFLIDLDLTRLGPMQLDGLYRGPKRAFDLIVRTRRPLPPEMRRDLLALWTQTAEALGLAGTLGFQTADRFVGPRDLPPDAPSADHGTGVIV